MTNTCLPTPLVVCGLIWLGPGSVLSFGPCGDVVMEGGVILPYCFQVSIAAQVQVLLVLGSAGGCSAVVVDPLSQEWWSWVSWTSSAWESGGGRGLGTLPSPGQFLVARVTSL